MLLSYQLHTHLHHIYTGFLHNPYIHNPYFYNSCTKCSTIMKLLAAPPEDACATTLHAIMDATALSGSYFARGAFASELITKVRSGTKSKV
jgi:hypothetical protein